MSKATENDNKRLMYMLQGAIQLLIFSGIFIILILRTDKMFFVVVLMPTFMMTVSDILLSVMTFLWQQSYFYQAVTVYF